jgi:hypothetical protein
MTDYADNQRGSGRTKRMVMSLPEGGCVVVIHENSFRDYLRHLIDDLRGGSFLKSVRIVPLADSERYLRGLRLPIFVDHYVSEYAFLHRRNSRIYHDYQWLMNYIPYNEARLNSK